MSILNRQLKQATKYSAFWHQLIPDLGTPDREQLLLWAGTYTEQNVVQGINRVARKVRKLKDTDAPMTLDAAIQYANGVMRNEKCGIRDFREFSGSTAHKENK